MITRRHLLLSLVAVLFFFGSCCHGDRIKTSTFITVQNVLPCVRRLNATHQMGCGGRQASTSHSGMVLAVRDDLELARLDTVARQLTDGEQRLMVATVPTYYSSVLKYQIDKDNKQKKPAINGIVLVATPDDVVSFATSSAGYSDDTPSPNAAFSLYKSRFNETTMWNPFGQAFMFNNFEIPIFLVYDVNETNAKTAFNDCYDKFNRAIFERADNSTPAAPFRISSADLLCGLELVTDMSAAVSSTVCIRRNNVQHTLDENTLCDPLGNLNYMSYLDQRLPASAPVHLVTARMDSFSMFEFTTPGASEPITSILGLLALADLLSKNRDAFTTTSDNQVLFVLFDNEALDYGGSSHFVNDILLGQFPTASTVGGGSYKLTKDKLKSMLELTQFGAVPDQFYVHKDPVSYENTSAVVEELSDSLVKFTNGTVKRLDNVNSPLPPASLQTFVRLGLSVPGVVVANHPGTVRAGGNFTERFYHSVYDVPQLLNVSFPANISEDDAANFTTPLASRMQPLLTGLARAIYNFTTAGKAQLPPEEVVDLTTLNRLVYCFYANPRCTFATRLFTPYQLGLYMDNLATSWPPNQLSFFAGTPNSLISGKWLTQVLFKYFTRNRQVDTFNSTECNSDSARAKEFMRVNNVTLREFLYVSNASVCMASAVFMTSSVSPAFERSDAGMLVNTDKFSAWTESRWSSFQMRLFLFPSRQVERLTIGLGVAIALLSIVLVFLVNKYSARLFPVFTPEQVTEILT